MTDTNDWPDDVLDAAAKIEVYGVAVGAAENQHRGFFVLVETLFGRTRNFAQIARGNSSVSVKGDKGRQIHQKSSGLTNLLPG